MRRLWLIWFLLASTALSAQAPKRELRGVWICTVNNLDWPSAWTLPVEEQKAELRRILDRAQETGLNAVFFQVRPSSDAFYESELEPWSQWLTGKQGRDPGYDPLAYLIEECEKRHLEVHAWFNLFRAVSSTKFSDIHRTHVSRQHSNWCYTFGPSKFLDPGRKEVRDYLVEVIADVATRYRIDGVHVDDYFYPEEGKGESIDDLETFRRESRGLGNIKDWRRENINLLIEGIHDTLWAIDRYIKFGVSPFPVWRHRWDDKRGSNTSRTLSCYDAMYADTRLWMEKGWVDYMAPQLYWSTEHKRVGYREMIDWWNDNHFGRHLYSGHNLGNVEKPTSSDWKNPEELPLQLRISRGQANFQGQFFFRVKNLLDNPLGIADTLSRSFYSCPALRPTMPWKDSIAPMAPQRLELKQTNLGVHLTWWAPPVAPDGDTASAYVVYRIPTGGPLDTENACHIIAITRQTWWSDIKAEPGKSFIYLVTTLDRMENESAGFVGQRHTPQPKKKP